MLSAWPERSSSGSTTPRPQSRALDRAHRRGEVLRRHGSSCSRCSRCSSTPKARRTSAISTREAQMMPLVEPPELEPIFAKARARVEAAGAGGRLRLGGRQPRRQDRRRPPAIAARASSSSRPTTTASSAGSSARTSRRRSSASSGEIGRARSRRSSTELAAVHDHPRSRVPPDAAVPARELRDGARGLGRLRLDDRRARHRRGADAASARWR